METYILEAIQLGTRMFQAGLATLGNSLTLVAVIKYKYLQTPSNMLVASLALADFLHGLVMLVTYPLRGVSRVLCVTSMTIESCTLWAQFMSFSLLAVERRCSLLAQLNRSTKWSMKKVFILEVLGWLAIVICNGYFGLNTLEVPEGALCKFSNHFIKSYKFVSIGFFGLTTIIIIVFYGAIAKIATASRQKVTPNNPEMQQQNQRRKADLRITRMMALVVGVFFSFYIPMTIAVSLMVESPPLWHHILEHIAINLFDVNFWINPLIYAWRNLQFRKAFKDILSSCRCCRRNSPMNGNSGPGANQSQPVRATNQGRAQGKNHGTGPSPLPLAPTTHIITVQPATKETCLSATTNSMRTSGTSSSST